MTKTSIPGKNLDEKEKQLAKGNGIEDEVKIFPLKKILSSKKKYQSPRVGKQVHKKGYGHNNLEKSRERSEPHTHPPTIRLRDRVERIL